MPAAGFVWPHRARGSGIPVGGAGGAAGAAGPPGAERSAAGDDVLCLSGRLLDCPSAGSLAAVSALGRLLHDPARAELP